MRVITDFHLHSRFSRACSKELTLPNIGTMCEKKGIQFVGTSDFTHPIWRQEIREQLVDDGEYTFRLKNEQCTTRFLLSTELSCIYKRGGKVRRVHHLILLSTFEALDKFVVSLEARGCNLKSDGRPILGLDSEELLKLVLDADPIGLLIPAHAWTPWFAVFGSQSGFDSLEECFGDMMKFIPAIETGLSSDPKMNWRLSKLDPVFLVSNSDAHSLDKLGREANVFEMARPSYQELHRIFVQHDQTKFIETIEFFPEEGKYHADGHRICQFFCEPKETKRLKGICPKCGRPLTVGVSYRIDQLANREQEDAKKHVPYRSIVPLSEVLADVMDVSASSKKVKAEYDRLIADGRSEFGVLLDYPLEELSHITSPEVVTAIDRMRRGEIYIRPGYDGEYGVISLMSPDETLKKTQRQISFFE